MLEQGNPETHRKVDRLAVSRFFSRLFHEEWRWVLYVLFYVLATNVPYWAASRWLGLLPLGWFCLEYAAVGLVGLFVPRAIVPCLLLLVVLADILNGVSKTYYLTPSECISNVAFARELSTTTLLGIAALLAVVILILAVAALFPVKLIRGVHRTLAVVCLAAFIVLAGSIDCLSVIRETGRVPNPFRLETPVDANKFNNYKNLWVSRYPLIRLEHDEVLFGGKRNASDAFQDDHSPALSATEQAIRNTRVTENLEISTKPNLVVIVLESWGLDANPSIRNALVLPYFHADLLAHYDVIQGTVPFNGSTVAAEARELCGNKLGFHIMNISTSESQGCLPDRLASLGYQTMALHGMDGSMFSRSTWYEVLGFQDQWFRKQFRKEGLQDCTGAFVGTCDTSIAQWISQHLEEKSPKPTFVYWVTLNSHLPVPVPPPPSVLTSCSIVPIPSTQAALCSWYYLVSNVHESVSKLAMANLSRPTVFVIVGDHAPPFANPILRSEFSAGDVPYIILKPH